MISPEPMVKLAELRRQLREAAEDGALCMPNHTLRLLDALDRVETDLRAIRKMEDDAPCWKDNPEAAQINAMYEKVCEALAALEEERR